MTIISSAFCRYTTAISQLSAAMTNVKHVLKAPAAVKAWSETEEAEFVLRPRREAPGQDGRRGSSSSWYLA